MPGVTKQLPTQCHQQSFSGAPCPKSSLWCGAGYSHPPGGVIHSSATSCSGATILISSTETPFFCSWQALLPLPCPGPGPGMGLPAQLVPHPLAPDRPFSEERCLAGQPGSLSGTFLGFCTPSIDRDHCLPKMSLLIWVFSMHTYTVSMRQFTCPAVCHMFVWCLVDSNGPSGRAQISPCPLLLLITFISSAS